MALCRYSRLAAICLLLTTLSVANNDATTKNMYVSVEEVALVQASLKLHHSSAETTSIGHRWDIKVKMENHLGLDFTVNCTATPSLCQPPFDCASNPLNRDPEEMDRWTTDMTNGSHSNLRLWCSGQNANTVVKHCLVDKDLVKAAEVLKQAAINAETDEIDASYCFIEGLCVDTNVTKDTTVEQAELFCDKRIPQWRNYNLADAQRMVGLKYDKTQGFRFRNQTRPILKAACVMGNYHCDVVHCKLSYCKDEHYKKKYEHFLKDYGWVE